MSSAQGTGGPIENAAAAAVNHEDSSPIEHYAKEAAAAVVPESSGMMTAAQALLQAQQRFIAAQTKFIHDKDAVDMRTAQVELIIELLDFIGAKDTATALTMGERYITDMHQLIEQRRLF